MEAELIDVSKLRKEGPIDAKNGPMKPTNESAKTMKVPRWNPN